MAPDPCDVRIFQRRDNLKGVFESMRREQPDLGLIVVILDKRGDVGPGYSKWLHYMIVHYIGHWLVVIFHPGQFVTVMVV